MNVNLTSSADNTKVTSATKSGETKDLESSESGETKGFLDKLVDLISGGKANATSSEAKSESKVTVDADTNSVSADDLLNQSEESDKAEGVEIVHAKVNSDEDKAKGDVSSENLKTLVADGEEGEVSDLKSKTAKAMDEGDKILGRLKEANQTLVKQDGKALPHEDAQESRLSIEPSADGSDTEMSRGDQDSEQVIDEKLVQLEANAVKDQHSVTQKSGKQASVASELLAMEQAPMSENRLKVQAKNAKDVQALSESDLAAIKAMQPKKAGEEQQALGDDNKLSPMAAAAIPWANVVASAETGANSKEGDKGSAKPTSRGVETQLTQQALQAQQALTQAEKATGTQSTMHAITNTDASSSQLQNVVNMQANPMLQAVMANQAEPSVNQAALKAGIEAKALGGLAEAKKSSQAADSTLAQQLSAAGQSGTNGPQGLRSDSLQSQQMSSPLHLSRGDMAADQMAERVQVMLSKNLKNIDIRLDPPELGKMHIRMNMNSDGATVHFTVANQHARDALEQSMPRLREMLNNQGVQLGDTSVQQQNSGQQQRYAAGGNGSGAQSASSNTPQGEENLDTNVKLDLNVASKRDGISYYA